MFICFEGIDGAGKSTQARMLQQALVAAGYKAELVADPGTTKIGSAIRQILLHNDAPITPVAQMLLFSAARAELAEYIRKKLRAKTIVVCDRWILSTLVYQGELNKIDPETILTVFHASDCPLPNLCFLLDLSIEAAKKRAGPARDRYERSTVAARRKMRDAYRRWGNGHDPRYGVLAQQTMIVDAAQTPAKTHKQVYKIVLAALKRSRFSPTRKEPNRARTRSP